MQQEIERGSVWRSRTDPVRSVTVLGTVTNLADDRLVVYQFTHGDTAHREVDKFLAMYEQVLPFAPGDVVRTFHGGEYLITDDQFVRRLGDPVRFALLDRPKKIN